MAYWEVTRVEIQEIIRRWQAGDGYRQIASGTGVSRNTVRKYLSAAKAEGIVRDGPAPTDDQLSRLAAMGQSGPRQVETPTEELLAPWADQIHRWLTGDRLQMTRIHELLLARGCPVTYQSVRRFILTRNWRRPRRITVRMEDTPPGEVAEVDFGRLGLIHDPETGHRRLVWGLLVVLGYSRHGFLWPTFGQKLPDVIAGLESAWAFFGGIPKYLVIDNFPPAVATADPLHPVFTRGFLEYSQRRGFITDAARARHPKDKPKVERGVPYARERFFKGGEFTDLADVRIQAQRWCSQVAGLRIHGTTRRQPLVVFQDEERQALLPWDGQPYEIAEWREAKVHQDHHILLQLPHRPLKLLLPGEGPVPQELVQQGVRPLGRTEQIAQSLGARRSSIGRQDVGPQLTQEQPRQAVTQAQHGGQGQDKGAHQAPVQPIIQPPLQWPDELFQHIRYRLGLPPPLPIPQH